MGDLLVNSQYCPRVDSVEQGHTGGGADPDWPHWSSLGAGVGGGMAHQRLGQPTDQGVGRGDGALRSGPHWQCVITVMSGVEWKSTGERELGRDGPGRPRCGGWKHWKGLCQPQVGGVFTP
jgi:hypothetical protein